ncbi:MAG: hypothetical protein EAZ44_00210 [Cytophagia bacterium]|nr:MAG: hypothetical protein EAZ44_00210 [Cytophagia bacterium]TAG44654.1 MAG: hypothetical protein EAZ31_01975 [Cytophagia bacterium]
MNNIQIGLVLILFLILSFTMNYYRHLSFLVVFLYIFIAQLFAQIIPVPQKVTIGNSFFTLKKELKIGFGNDIEAQLLQSAVVINKSLKDYKNIISIIEPNPNNANIVLALVDSNKIKNLLPTHLQDFHKETYKIIIKEKAIIVEASTPKGVFYGGQSLAQLIAHAKDNKIQCQEIIDYPDYAHRGISDDISRGQVSTIKNFKKIIDQLARFKMNTYFLYLEDIVFLESFSSIGKDRGALKKEEIKEIVDYAQKNFIQVIPIFETFGHQENILSQGTFEKMAEFSGAMSLCVECPFTYQYLEKTIAEIAKMFPSPYFHIGGDESFDAGVSKSKDFTDSVGIAGLHLYHYQKVYDICKKNGKKVMMYGDMLEKFPQILSKMPKDIIIMDWQYFDQADYPTTQLFSQVPQKYWALPTVFNFKTIFPLHQIAFPTTLKLANIGLQRNAKGFITSNWGDMGNDSPKELLYYLYAWTAQCGWTATKSQAVYFDRYYFSLFFDEENPQEITQIYQQLIKPEMQINWVEFWRHPAMPFRKASFWQGNINTTTRNKMIEKDLIEMEKKIKILKKRLVNPKDTVNISFKQGNETLEVWEWVIKMKKYYLLKVKAQVILQLFQQKKASNNEILSKIDENLTELAILEKETEKIWKTYYKPEGLEYLVGKFQKMKNYFTEIKQQITEKKEIESTIKSKWIYLKKDNTNYHEKVTFKKSFVIEERPSEVLLHLAADTYAEVYLNGEKIDVVFVRNIFSIQIESELTKIIDLKPFIQLGTNTLEIKTVNYNQGLKRNQYWTTILGSLGAGINAAIFIKNFEDEQLIYSDTTWEGIWDDENIKNKFFKKVVEKKYHYDLIYPNFKTRRQGFFER